MSPATPCNSSHCASQPGGTAKATPTAPAFNGKSPRTFPPAAQRQDPGEWRPRSSPFRDIHRQAILTWRQEQQLAGEDGVDASVIEYVEAALAVRLGDPLAALRIGPLKGGGAETTAKAGLKTPRLGRSRPNRPRSNRPCRIDPWRPARRSMGPASRGPDCDRSMPARGRESALAASAARTESTLASARGYFSKNPPQLRDAPGSRA